jgi:DNA-binding PadR family transcriptional regulator
LGRTQDPTILVLTSLTSGPKHGYAIIKDIESLTGTAFGPGTLYGVLVRLEEEGLVEALASNDRRRPYRITGHGAAVLTERLQTSLKVATIGLRQLGAMGEATKLANLVRNEMPQHRAPGATVVMAAPGVGYSPTKSLLSKERRS